MDHFKYDSSSDDSICYSCTTPESEHGHETYSQQIDGYTPSMYVSSSTHHQDHEHAAWI